MDENSPVFAIAMAAELAGMHPQTLRQYDRLGLVSPTRTAGKSRRYSMRDVAQLREIARLSAEGVSLTGISRILALENQVTELTMPCCAPPADASSPPAPQEMWSRCAAEPAPSDAPNSWSGDPAEGHTPPPKW
jgi:DNA-binding transcriptional MerR regulator